MKAHTVHLGFEVGSADPVEIPIRHMAVTGQTQESGKTTTLEALITRSGLPAIAFLTKRGEGSFSNARRVLPYFKERTDWQFVQSIIESVMRQDQKFKQPWIMRACEGARTLADVQRRAAKLEDEAKHAMSQDMYMVLGAYLEKVVPIIATLPKTDRVEIHEGELAVMDLIDYPDELQMLVISSTLEWIHKHESGVITVMPEAWKFVPQGRNTPVKIVAEKLIREGAGLKNYLWIDSQDMAAVDKMLLRACAVWLIGNQREANELKRALSNMPEGLKKPKAGELATLELGQFYACFGKSILKTYVQPTWMNETAGSAIAAGRLDVHKAIELSGFQNTTKAKQPAHAGTQRDESPAGSPAIALDSPILRTSATEEEEMPINEDTLTALRMAINDGAKETALNLVDALSGGTPVRRGMVEAIPRQQSLAPAAFASKGNGAGPSELSDALYSQILNRLLQDLPEHPRVLQLVTSRPEIVVKVQKKTVELDATTVRGRLAILISENFFDETVGGYAAWKHLGSLGFRCSNPNVYRELDSLTEMGFLTKSKQGYSTVPGMKVTKNRIEA
jgi:hypothetical protein